jgi:tryptophan-rich sensory protein
MLRWMLPSPPNELERGGRLRELASSGQLRAAYLRWAVVTVPFILLLGFASARVAPSGDDNAWFVALTKPALMPPNWVFGAVWSILYVLIGLALAMILHARGSRGRGAALALFAAQMLANLAWAPLFFGAHQVVWSLMTLGVLFLLAAATTLAFAKVRGWAAVQMLPFLAWIAFAGLLLSQIQTLNPNAETLVPSPSSTQIQL